MDGWRAEGWPEVSRCVNRVGIRLARPPTARGAIRGHVDLGASSHRSAGAGLFRPTAAQYCARAPQDGSAGWTEGELIMRVGRASVALLVAVVVSVGSPLHAVGAGEPVPGAVVAANSLLPLVIPPTETSCDELGESRFDRRAVADRRGSSTVPFCVNALPIQGPPWTGWGGSSTARPSGGHH